MGSDVRHSRQFGFSFDQGRCTGCKTCEMACKDYHDLGGDLAFRTICEFAGGTWHQDGEGAWEQDVFAFYVSMSCNHCSNPVCLRICPSEAVRKDDLGFVMIDPGACDGCRDRVENGLGPICVEACPQRALGFGVYDDLSDRPLVVERVATMPDPRITQPNYAIKPCDFAESKSAGDSSVVNPLEV